MKKNSLKVLSVIGTSIVPFVITPLIVSCSKGEDLSNAKMYDKNYRILFNGAGEILDYDGNATELEIPEYLENNSVTSSPYYGKRIQIKKIGFQAFQWDKNEDSGRPKLQKVTLPNSINYIDTYAFSKNELTQVTIPKSVKVLSGFDNNKLTSIDIPNSVTRIETDAFYNCAQLTQITIPDSVTYIGSSAFSFTRLTQITIPDSVTEIKSGAFFNTKLTQVIIPNSITFINSSVFAETPLTQITIPNSVTYVAEYAFANTKLTEVTLPPNCKYESNAFPESCIVNGGIKID